MSSTCHVLVVCLETPWIAQRSSHADQQSSHSQSLAALAKPRATHHILVLGGATSCSHVRLMFRVFLYFRAKECTEQKTDANSTNPLKAARVLAHDVAPRVSRCSRKVNLPSRACLTLEHARLRHGAHPVQARWIKCCSPAT